MVAKTNVMREIVRLLPKAFHFRRFPGSQRALLELKGWRIGKKVTVRQNSSAC